MYVFQVPAFEKLWDQAERWIDASIGNGTSPGGGGGGGGDPDAPMFGSLNATQAVELWLQLPDALGKKRLSENVFYFFSLNQ